MSAAHAKPFEVEPQLAARRAIEALRAGVPSGHAVAALGSGQDAIEDRVTELLEAAHEAKAGGVLLGGGFGSGKSHLLEHLARLASTSNFVVSRVVISKETPLHDPIKVFLAAADSALAPADLGPAIAVAATELDIEGRGYAELLEWASSAGADLNPRFPASLVLYARARDRDDELADMLVRFWSGDPLPAPELRRRLKEFGEGPVVVAAVAPRELALQRTRFAARLFRAAGYAGWLVLFDEVELIGRYSLLARAKSYGEIARWITGTHGAPSVPLAAVMAMTDDYEAAVLAGRKDRELVGAKLRQRETPEAADSASQAEAGMRIIDRDMLVLTPPDEAELNRAYQQLKALHAMAFDWAPPDVPSLERLGATRMRQYVRAWINEWDLVRLDPAFTPDTTIVDIASDYTEDDESADINALAVNDELALDGVDDLRDARM